MKVVNAGVIGLFLIGIGWPMSVSANTISVTPVEEVRWEKLNPARGEKSPQAATLWGDRKGQTATGFLVKFIDGFSSPPHIHNVSYRGIVIDGLVHNDDPAAAMMWMPAGSYWTQPAGESHITAAKGVTNIAFIEIDNGPYLVKPKNEAFDNGERPYNLHRDNVIWRNRLGYEVVDLWKDRDQIVSGKMYRFDGEKPFDLAAGKIVVVKGRINFKGNSLGSGSLIDLRKTSTVIFKCVVKKCVIYHKI